MMLYTIQPPMGGRSVDYHDEEFALFPASECALQAWRLLDFMQFSYIGLASMRNGKL